MSNDQRMAENARNKDHPWSALSTVTTFDRGNNMMSTVCINNESQTNGQMIKRVAPSTSVLIESLIQQLCIMFEGDKIRRNKLYFAICDKMHELDLIDSSYNMMEFEAVRAQYQFALYHLVTVARAATGSESALNVPSCLMSEWSRYHREFHEITFIASGGFGKVFKALHHLDGIEYAIKKIVVHTGCVETIRQHLEEVKTLAKLNHINIVPYKAAWIEPTLISSFISSMPFTNHKSHKPCTSGYMKRTKSYNTQSEKNFDSDKSSFNLSNDNRQGILLDSKTSCVTGMYNELKKIEKQNSMNGIEVAGYTISHDTINKRFHELNSLTNIIGPRMVEKISVQECIEETNSDIVSFRNSKSSRTSDQTENNTNRTDDSSSHEQSISHQELCRYTSNRNQQYMTLYIQMALCEQTLEQWMCKRINVTPQPMVIAVLQQLLCGIDYMHSQKVVHHDIKPSNIFISTLGQLQIQLGDFGLACPLQKENHRSVIGTHMYAAPEQLQGKCDPKSDIYSVGIVLIELLIPTRTQMELSCIIKCLKHGNIPEALIIDRSKWAHLIRQLMHEDPIKRPCTKQLLHDLNVDKDMMIAELKSNIVDKDNTILELQEKVSLLEEELRKVKMSPGNT